MVFQHLRQMTVVARQKQQLPRNAISLAFYTFDAEISNETLN